MSFIRFESFTSWSRPEVALYEPALVKLDRRLSFLLFLLSAGLALSGCGSSTEDTIISGPFPYSPTAPVARPDTYTIAAGTSLTAPAPIGVLANDSTNAAPGQPVSVRFPSVTVRGGSVTMTSDEGSFVYTPATGYLGIDTFEYELSNGAGVSRTTVTIDVTVNGPGFFVDSRTGDDATGNFQSGAPFATIQAAVTAAGPSADITVLPGSGTYAGQIELLDGQRLLGAQSLAVNAQGFLLPTLSGPIILADDNTVDSVRVDGTAGIAIDGDGQDSGVVTNCQVVDTVDGTGIQIRGVTGQWRIENNLLENIGGIGLDMDTQNDGTAAIRANHNIISECRNFGLGIAAFGQSELAVQANDNILYGNGRGLGPDEVDLGYLCGTTGTATLTVQLIGNFNNGIYGFAQGGSSSTLNVERFAQMSEFNIGVPVVLEGSVTDVPQGSTGL